jgi:hypothetical protein
MECDALKEATIVTADGEMVTVKDSDDPESNQGMLFWELCGAGGGDFGVVAELKMEVQRPQSKDGSVVAERHTWYPTPEEEADVISAINHFYTTAWLNQMTIDSTWLCDLEKTLDREAGKLGIRFLAYYDGDVHGFEKQINGAVVNKELAYQLKRRCMPEKSTRFLYESLVPLWRGETKIAFSSDGTLRIFSSFAFTNDLATIESVTAIVKEELAAFRCKFQGEKGLAQASFIHSGGQVSRTERSTTSFRWRDSFYHTYITLQWNDKWLERDMRGFCQRFKARLKPFSICRKAVYINFPDGYIGRDNHEKAYYGNNRQKLQQIKQIWDLDNYFD